MVKNSVKTTNKNEVIKASKLDYTPVNQPKNNSITSSCLAIADIASKGKPVKPGLTALGHIANCKGGVIDTCILSGKANCLQHFVDALINSGLKIVNDDVQKYGYGKTLNIHLAKRVVDHVVWCNNTLNKSHGGFADRLKNVNLQGYHVEIAGHLDTLATALQGGLSVLKKA